MTEFTAPPHLALPYIPDNLTIPQFILDSSHPLRQIRQEETPWFIEEHTGKGVGYEELRTRTFGLANALKLKYNICEDDVVCIFSPNHIDYIAVVWAVHRLGAIVSTANPAYTADELVHQLTTAKTTLLVSQSGFYNTAFEATKKVGIPESSIILLDSPSNNTTSPSIQELISFGLQRDSSFVERRLNSGEGKTKIAFLCFSSGTTGKPKAVAIAHTAVIANVIQLSAHYKFNDDSIPWDDRRFRPGDVVTGILPFFHIYGLVVNAHWKLFAGMTVIIFAKFDFIPFLRSIVRYRITHLVLVPPMLVLLCKHPAVKDFDLSNIRGCFSGAAPLSQELIDQLVKLLPSAVVGQGYGMTETSTVVSTIPHWRRIGSGVGTLIPGVRARVIKQDGSLAKAGETGELVVTGPSMALRYTNNAKATEETFVDGWVRTGDEVMFAQDGHLFIVDRLKELIKVRGFQVAPAELEGHLLSHPDVADVCVVPVPDDYSGEVPLAYIVPRGRAAERIKDPQDAEKVKAALIKYVADNKTKFKWLAGGVEFIDAIPKNPSGKLLRRVLRDRAREARAVIKAKL